MSWDKVIYNVAERLPDFNNELLIGYKKRNVDNCKNYLEEVIIAVIDHINESMHDLHVDYVGYEVKSPREQLRYASLETITKGIVSALVSGLRGGSRIPAENANHGNREGQNLWIRRRY